MKDEDNKEYVYNHLHATTYDTVVIRNCDVAFINCDVAEIYKIP